MSFKVTSHQLVVKHTKVSDSERDKLLKRYNVNPNSLPKILKTDSAIAHLDIKAGDIIKIERKSQTAGVAYYYRTVIEE